MTHLLHGWQLAGAITGIYLLGWFLASAAISTWMVRVTRRYLKAYRAAEKKLRDKRASSTSGGYYTHMDVDRACQVTPLTDSLRAAAHDGDRKTRETAAHLGMWWALLWPLIFPAAALAVPLAALAGAGVGVHKAIVAIPGAEKEEVPGEAK
jgi:hypothetical protein